MTLEEAYKIANDLLLKTAEEVLHFSDTQKDIIDTIKAITADPFDRDSAMKRIVENNQKNLDYTFVMASSNNVKFVGQMSKEELIGNLQTQLIFLVSKMLKEQNND